VNAATVLAHAGHSHDGGFDYVWISYGVIALGVIYAAYLVARR
jgi:hypothetical protein